MCNQKQLCVFPVCSVCRGITGAVSAATRVCILSVQQILITGLDSSTWILITGLDSSTWSLITGQDSSTWSPPLAYNFRCFSLKNDRRASWIGKKTNTLTSEYYDGGPAEMSILIFMVFQAGLVGT